MASSTPGRRRVREYLPPRLRFAMLATRLANASWALHGISPMRYQVVCNVHEGIDPEQPLWILDSHVAELNRLACLNGHSLTQEPNRYGPTGPYGHEYLSVAELLERLPEDKLIKYEEQVLGL